MRFSTLRVSIVMVAVWFVCAPTVETCTTIAADRRAANKTEWVCLNRLVFIRGLSGNGRLRQIAADQSADRPAHSKGEHLFQRVFAHLTPTRLTVTELGVSL